MYLPPFVCKNFSYRVWLHISRSSHLPKFFVLTLSEPACPWYGYFCLQRCCGSEFGFVGSVSFWGLDPDPDPLVRGTVWIRILLSASKNSKKNLDSYCFVTLFLYCSFKNDVNLPSKSNKQKNFTKNLFFVGNLMVNDNSRSGSESGSRSISQRQGSTDPDPLKCQGSATLVYSLQDLIFHVRYLYFLGKKTTNCRQRLKSLFSLNFLLYSPYLCFGFT